MSAIMNAARNAVHDKKSFSARIRTAVILISGLSIVIFNIVCFSSAKKILREDFFSRNEVIVEQANECLNEYIGEYIIDIDMVAENEVICQSVESGLYNWSLLPTLQNLVAMDRNIINVEIYGLDQSIYYGANDILSAKNDKELVNAFEVLDNSGDTYKALLYETAPDWFQIVIIRSIISRGTRLGYIVLYMDRAQIIEAYHDTENFVKPDNIYISDTNGRIVSLNTGAKASRKEIGTLFADEAGGAPADGIYTTFIDKLDMKVFFCPATENVSVQINRVMYKNIIISVLMFMVCVFGAHMLGRSISEPIEDIKRYLKENLSE